MVQTNNSNQSEFSGLDQFGFIGLSNWSRSIVTVIDILAGNHKNELNMLG